MLLDPGQGDSWPSHPLPYSLCLPEEIQFFLGFFSLTVSIILGEAMKTFTHFFCLGSLLLMDSGGRRARNLITVIHLTIV